MVSIKVIRSGLGSIAIKLAGAILSFVTTAFLSRSLSIQEFGFYSVVVSVITFILIPTQLGLPVLVMREAASAKAKKDYRRIIHLRIFCHKIIASLALILCGILFLAAFFDYKVTSWLGQKDILVIIITIVSMSWLAIVSAQIRGYSYSLLGQLPEVLFRPLSFVIIWGGGYLYFFGQLSHHTALLVLLLSVVLSCLLAKIILSLIVCPPTRGVEPVKPVEGWWIYIMPLAILSGAQVINGQVDIVMIGFFRPIEEVANYRISIQMAVLISFGLHALTAMSAPVMATLYKKEKFNDLKEYVFQISIMNLLISFPIFLVFLVWGKNLIAFFFGDQYSAAFQPLMILALAQLVHALLGPVTTLMNMLGNERWSMKTVIITSILNVILNAILVPIYGMIGAAISTAISLSLSNITLWVMLKRINGIDSSIWSTIKLSKGKS